ncbi:hypothetical protein K9K77_03500 [Candidatus Babeliales bacterium]|nr:hypothetical protein [Candidatus Babeliales bacterium]
MTARVLFYNGVKDFEKDLYRLGLPKSLVDEHIDHESAHLNKARELGYKADYCITFPTGDPNNFRPAIKIHNSQDLTNEDLMKILSAVNDPSDKDIERLKSLEAL